MMSGTRILQMGLDSEPDVVTVRQRARQIAGLLKLGVQDQVRVATAVSEVARCAYGRLSGGRAVFAVNGQPAQLEVTITAESAVRHGMPPEQLGEAILTAQRLMDDCSVVSATAEALHVVMRKALPQSLAAKPREVALIGAQLASTPVQSTYSEIEQQNRELAQALAELRERQEDLLGLTRELEDTNRGVVALYAEIEDKAERLRKADEMKSRFLSNTSHELRTPLSSIRALTQLLLDRMDGPLTPEQERQVSFISQAASDLSELVNDLLDLAKIEAGKVDLTLAPVPVGQLFSALKGMLRPLTRDSAVELIFVEPPPVTLMSDESKITQILRNFISNALKFTEQGQVVVELREYRLGDRLTFAVTDSGIGISPENQQLIFEEFSQIEHPLQRRAKGTGLGLPLCRKLAALLGGEVSVCSAEGQGSTFFLRLPATI